MGILLDLAYLTAGVICGPWILLARWRRGKKPGNRAEKFLGLLPKTDSGKRCLWLHAVSVGEVLQLQSVIAHLRARFPLHDFLISTTTTSGYGVAVQKFGAEHQVCYFPFDFSWSVRRALRRVRPELVILVELELWPNFLRSAARMGIPVCLINGRITEKSFRLYRWIRPLMRSMLSHLKSLQVQNDLYARRFIELGAEANRVEVTGSIKFDGICCDRNKPAVKEIQKSFGIGSDEIVFVAGSTQDPEEELALSCYESLRGEIPELRLMLVPRNPERFNDVAKLVTQRGHGLIRRSEVLDSSPIDGSSGSPAVLLLDTLGELSAAWGIADVAFVGGSLGRRGGQNMIEPAGYGACVLFGPNTWNFHDVVQMLLEAEAAVVVPTAGEFTPILRKYLLNRELARSQGSKAQRLIVSRQGTTLRTVKRIAEMVADVSHEEAAAA